MRHILGNGDQNPVDVFTMGGELNHAHDIDAHALASLDLAGAVTVRAILVDAPFQARPDALSRHLDQAKGGYAQDLGPGPITADCLAQSTLDAPAMFLVPHVDKVVDDHAAKIAQAKLAGDFAGRVQVHLVGGLFRVIVRPEIPAVDVDGNQRLR